MRDAFVDLAHFFRVLDVVHGAIVSRTGLMALVALVGMTAIYRWSKARRERMARRLEEAIFGIEWTPTVPLQPMRYSVLAITASIFGLVVLVIG